MYKNEGDEFLKSIITCDETYLQYYDPEDRKQSSEWRIRGQPPPKKVHKQPFGKKLMALVFFDFYGILCTHFVEPGTTLNGLGFSDVLKTKLRRAILNKRQGTPIHQKNKFYLHMDNARPHIANIAKLSVDKIDGEILPHPANSPDLSPCDFYLFTKLKRTLRGHHFENDNEVKAATKSALRQLGIDGFEDVFRSWVRKWEKCIKNNGDYVEHNF